MEQPRREQPGATTRGELIGMVRRIMAVDGSEQELHALLEAAQRAVPHPALSDLIYWPDQSLGFGNQEPTAEQIVDFALAYRPRLLPEGELAEKLHAFMHPRKDEDSDSEAYYLLSENLPGYELNLLTDWACRNSLTAEELIKRVRSDGVRADPGCQEALAKTYDC